MLLLREGRQWLQRGQGLLPVTGLGTAAVGALWQQRLVANMTQGAARWGPASFSRSEPRAPSSLAQEQEQRWELEALRAELGEEWLRTQELRRRFTAETRELKAALEREQQLLAEQLQCQWQQRQAQELRRLLELSQRQRVAETHELLRWKEAELHKGQQLLRRACTAAVRQTRDLQRQLAQEMGRPSRSGREAQSKLRDLLSKLRWETDGDQPTHICHLQNQLQLERRLFIKYILRRFEGKLPTSPSTAQPQTPPGHQCQQETQSSCSSSRSGPRALVAPQQRPPESHSAGQRTARKAVAAAQLQLPEGEALVLLGSKCSRLQEKNTCLQRLQEDLERQKHALERESHLLTKEGSPEAGKEAQRLQQKSAQLAALAWQLQERSRQLQATIHGLISTQVLLPTQSQQLFQEPVRLERGRSSRIISRPPQANPGADKESILLEAMRKQPAELRAFIARYSYDPFHAPNERPELELPLVAGQYVYVFGDVDEDGWYVGELTDGTRGFIPSNLVEEVSGDEPPDDTSASSESSDW